MNVRPLFPRWRRATARCSDGGRIRARNDDGVAVVEFVMISALLVFLLFGVLQVAAVLYIRSVVAASAADGARYAAAAGVGPAAGGARADELMAQAVSGSLSSNIPCTGSEVVDAASGLRVVQVECRGRIRSIFVPAGVFVNIRVRSRSLEETP